jgi:hypothetical protein
VDVLADVELITSVTLEKLRCIVRKDSRDAGTDVF